MEYMMANFKMVIKMEKALCIFLMVTSMMDDKRNGKGIYYFASGNKYDG